MASALLGAAVLVASPSSAAPAVTASIAGTVSRVDGGSPRDIQAYLFDSDAAGGDRLADAVANVATGDSGRYTFRSVSPGSYKVKFRGGDTKDEYWDDETDFDQAATIEVDDGEAVTGIDAELDPGAFIHGSVSGTVGTEGLELQMTVYRKVGAGSEASWVVHRVEQPWSAEYPTSFGAPGLPLGTYRVELEDLSGLHGYGPQFGNGVIDFDQAPEYTFTQPAWQYVTPQLVRTDRLVNTAAPSIDDVAPRVGETLVASPGTWTPGVPDFGYQWLADGVPIAGATSSTFTTTAAQAGKRLTARVSASSASLPAVSADSPATYVVPVDMTAIAATGRSSSTATIAWSAVPGAVRYWVGTGASIELPVGAATSHVLTGLAPGSRYRASVAAEFADGIRSDWRSIDVLTAPATPSGPGRVKITKTSAKLRLTPVAGAARYVISYRAGRSKAKTRTISSRSRFVTLSKLKKRTKYTVTVTALSPDGVPSAAGYRSTFKTRR
jgi:hypothetical protein